MTRILVFDDEPRVQAALRSDLARLPYELSFTSSFDDALYELHAPNPPDVLITSTLVAGREAAEILEDAVVAAPHIATIITVGEDVPAPPDLHGMAVAVLKRPFTRQQLQEALHYAIECRQGFRGQIHGIGLIDLLQMLHLARRTTAVVVNAYCSGRIFLFQGEIVHAECGPQAGETALAYLLTNNTGHLRTEPIAEPTAEVTIVVPFDMLILEIIRRQDEAYRDRALLSVAPPPGRYTEAPRRPSTVPPRDEDETAEDAALRWLEECRAAGGVSDTMQIVAIDLASGDALPLQGDALETTSAEHLRDVVASARALTDQEGDGALEYLTDHIGMVVVWRPHDRLAFIAIDEVRPGSLTTWFRWRTSMIIRSLAEELRPHG